MKSIAGLASLSMSLFITGCNHSPGGAVDNTPQADLLFGGFGDDPLGMEGAGGAQTQATHCGDFDPACIDAGLGPDEGTQFPLGGDPMKDPDEKDDGVGRDGNGWLGLSQ